MRAFEFITETQMIWRRNAKTGKITLKWRCTSGPKANRTVAKPQDCSAAPDIGKREQMKKTRARTKIRQARRTKRTKKINPASRIATRLNKLNKRSR